MTILTQTQPKTQFNRLPSSNSSQYSNIYTQSDNTIAEPGSMSTHPSQHDIYKMNLHEQPQYGQQPYKHTLVHTNDINQHSPTASYTTIQQPLPHQLQQPNSSAVAPQQYYQPVYQQSPMQPYNNSMPQSYERQQQQLNSHSTPAQTRALPNTLQQHATGSPMLNTRNTSNEDISHAYYAQQLQQQYMMQQHQHVLQQQAMMQAAMQPPPQSQSANNTPQQYSHRLPLQTPYQQQSYMPMQYPYMPHLQHQQQQLQQPQQTSYKAVIECGILNRATGHRVLTMYEPYFNRDVEVYTATSDPLHRTLYRASLLSDKFECASNKLCMYLSRRRSAADGVYQSISFLEKPTGHTGLKSGNYFITMTAALAFERHFMKQHFRRTAKENDEQTKSQQSSDKSATRTISGNNCNNTNHSSDDNQLNTTDNNNCYTADDNQQSVPSTNGNMKRESSPIDDSSNKKPRTSDDTSQSPYNEPSN